MQGSETGFMFRSAPEPAGPGGNPPRGNRSPQGRWMRLLRSPVAWAIFTLGVFCGVLGTCGVRAVLKPLAPVAVKQVQPTLAEKPKQVAALPKLVINYNQTYGQMLAAAGVAVSKGSTLSTFHPRYAQQGTVVVGYELVPVIKGVTTAQLESELKGRGLRSANLPELLGYLQQYKDFKGSLLTVSRAKTRNTTILPYVTCNGIRELRGKAPGDVWNQMGATNAYLLGIQK